ncbi:MAG: SDR family NAD(P)-dependent oxidoreductase [Solirubrobacterales bacterium]|nr:SDR family NAD(P)-dependent oxidoreductase [Solirubrobacterales bacterium]
MKLEAGKVAVVTGAASGIGFALAERFARDGLDVVLADVEEDALASAAERIAALDVETLAVSTDVSDSDAVQALADAAVERFGSVHVMCNNAGVSSGADPWFGPLSAWSWVLGVNLWGVVHGIRAFLPILINQGEGHIVNTASIAGLNPGSGPIYAASKHAVVALSEELFKATKMVGLPVGVSVLCPGWVRTGIWEADRNWPARLGKSPPQGAAQEVLRPHYDRAIGAGTDPAAIADFVAEAIMSSRFWILPHPEWVERAARRWRRIAEGLDPDPADQVPGFPPFTQIASEIQAALTAPTS